MSTPPWISACVSFSGSVFWSSNVIRIRLLSDFARLMNPSVFWRIEPILA
jgi:hypothetical protein